MKDFFSLFSQKSKGFYFFIFACACFNGVLNTVFMVIIGKAISKPGFSILKGYDSLIFLTFFFTCFIINYVFDSYLIRISAEIVTEVELNMVQKIREASFARISLIGKEEIYAALGNLDILGEAPVRFVAILNPLLTVILSVGYLYLTMFIYGLIVTSIIALMLWVYLGKRKNVTKKYDNFRKLQISYHGYLNDLLFAFKDLKISSVKNENIYSKFIVSNKRASSQVEIDFRKEKYKANLIAGYVWYFLLGIILFMLPKPAQVGLPGIATVVVIIIYIIGPVSSIIGIVHFHSALTAATSMLDGLRKRLSSDNVRKFIGKDSYESLPEFDNIRFDRVCFDYMDETNRKTFSLGPLNLLVKRAEIIFVTGGNGSGKSTFLNLLAGLVLPTDGEIFFNDRALSLSHYNEYRDQLAAVFFEGYIPSQNYENFVLDSTNDIYVRYLKMMELTEVAAMDMIFECRARLSKGQQKRLAFVLALLMKKKILILDEWAAEQDSSFKKIFYQEILPLLREGGMTIIAITHDDEYFYCADRVIKLSGGRIVLEQDRASILTQQPTVVIPTVGYL